LGEGQQFSKFDISVTANAGVGCDATTVVIEEWIDNCLFELLLEIDEAVDATLGKDGWISHVRNSQIWMFDRFVPYPFQNNIHQLPFKARWQCLLGLFIASIQGAMSRPVNFLEWINTTFGRGIAQTFMIPYNKKVWAHPPEQLDVGWMGERVPQVKFWPIFKNTILKIATVNWGPNNMFRFPKTGATGQIWRKMAESMGEGTIQLKRPVKRIDINSKIVSVHDEDIKYDYLISSLPLPQLAAMSTGLPDDLKRKASELKYSSSHIVGIGLKGRPPASIKDIGWMYFPDPEIPYYRATILSNYSPHCVPPGEHWSLLLEVSESEYWNKGLDSVVEKCVAAALRTKFIASEKDIVSTWYKKMKFGYPTPHLGRDEILNSIQPVLEKAAIYSRGRFGGWKYEASNQDHAFMQGVEVINKLINDEPEITYPTPHIANRIAK
jgi:protoporphyrinogen oxidase